MTRTSAATAVVELLQTPILLKPAAKSPSTPIINCTILGYIDVDLKVKRFVVIGCQRLYG
jgi:hypothetical protein